MRGRTNGTANHHKSYGDTFPPRQAETSCAICLSVACGSEDGRSDWSKADRVAHGWGLVLIRLSLSVGTSGPCGLLLPGADYCGAKRYHL
jgi:hypothetical protein